jgi:DNA processing protein
MTQEIGSLIFGALPFWMMDLKGGWPVMDEGRIAWLSLKLIPELGNRSILRLLRHFKTPSAILRASAGDLASVPGIQEKARLALLRKAVIRSPHAEWETLQKEGISLLCLNDPQYPANLAAIPDPPAALFVRGGLEPRDLVSVAVVGSRAASPMGLIFTERLCSDLAQGGVTIVSGLAVGIDSAAHRGALKVQGRTLAVLGCGLDVDYPRGHARLRKDIIQSGAVLTEFPLGTPPAPGHFPMRNRIISGLALGVVVVEAAHRSGSLITARMALEQGREVFAVPGMARHYRSVGPHRLLKQGAKLVESAEDILEEIRPLIRPSWLSGAEAKAITGAQAGTREEAALLQSLDQHPRHIDEICRTLQWPVSQVMCTLLSLELKGAVEQLPGKYFVCKG